MHTRLNVMDFYKKHKNDIIGGFVGFVTTLHQLFIIPQILSNAGIPIRDGTIATALSIGITTIIAGLITKKPILMGPGVGISAYLVFNVVNGMGIDYGTALAGTFIEGIIFFGLSISKIRQSFANAISPNLKVSILAGIGLYLIFLGLIQSGIVKTGPNMFFMKLDIASPTSIIALFTLLLATVLTIRNVKGAFIWAIVISLIVSMSLGISPLPDSIVSSVDIPKTMFLINTYGLKVRSLLSVVLAIFMIDFLDTLGTATALLMRTHGHTKDIGKIMISDSLGTIVSSIIGVPASTTYVETLSMVGEKAKTHISSIVAGLLFVCAMIFYPIIEVTPQFITAPILIIIGTIMFSTLRFEKYDDLTEVIPSMIIVGGIPATMSIAYGISIGLISYVLIKVLVGKWRDVHPFLYALTVLLALDYFMLI